MNLFTGRQARPQASINSLKWLWISCQILLLSSFALLSGCDGGDSSSSTTPASSTTTPSSSEPTGSVEIKGWGTPPTLVTPTTNDEAKRMLDLSSQVIDEFMNNMVVLRKTLDANVAIQRAVDDLKKNSKVVAVEYKSESLLIYTSLGDKAYILLDAQYREKQGLNATSLSSPSTINGGIALKNPSEVFLQNLNSITIQSVSPSTGNKRALILSGFQKNFGEDLCPIKEALESGGFKVDFVVDIEMCGVPATTFDKRIIEYVNILNEYDVIYFNTHGNIDVLNLGIPYDPNKSSEELLSFKRNEGVYLSDKYKTLGITTKYITNSFKLKKFKDSLIIMDVCHSGETANMPNAFLENGAAVYIGYNNTSSSNVQTPQFSIPLFQRMTKIDISMEKALTEPSKLPTHWGISYGYRECNSWGFGCQHVETEGVNVITYETEAVRNDPEGFILVPKVTDKNTPPSVSISKPFTNSKFSVGTSVVFEGMVSDKDGSVVTYGWDFEGNGQYAVTNALSTAYTYTKAGIYKVTLRAQDNQGATNTATVQIEITNPTPIANQSPVVSSITAPATVKVNTPFSISYSYSDPDGLSDVKWHYFAMSDNTSYKVADPQKNTGTLQTQPTWMFPNIGRQWLEVSVEDSAGNRSAAKRAYVDVVQETTTTTTDQTTLSGTYSGTKTYMAGAEAGTTYNITISSLSETSTMLSGTYTVSGLGSSLSGMRTGNTVNFSTKPAGNPTCTHTFTGTIGGNTISGMMTTANNCNGSGTWTVTKK